MHTTKSNIDITLHFTFFFTFFLTICNMGGVFRNGVVDADDSLLDEVREDVIVSLSLSLL